MMNFSHYLIRSNQSVKEALIALNRLSADTLTLFVVDPEGKMTGTVTDGDIRRKLIDGICLNDPIYQAMNPDFYYLNEKEIDIEKVKIIKNKGIALLPVLSSDRRIIKVLNLKKKKSVLPMGAVIMAGGKGERLRPLTEKTPKPLLKVGEKCIIDYNIDNLLTHGIEHIYVTVNYLGEQLEKHFEQERDGIKIRCIKEPCFLGTIGSVKFIPSFCNDTVLIMNSDLFTNINLEDFYLHFQKNNADMAVAAIPYSISVPYGIFKLEEREIKGVLEKPTYNYYANSGIYLIKRKLLEMIPENTFYNATDFMEKLIAGGFRVIRFPLVGYWIDIGKPEDYRKAQDFAKHL